MFLKFLLFFISLIPALVIVGFITLLERKILGLSQLRLGPNKVGWAGIPQPLSDAIKLFSKVSFFPIILGGVIFNMSPAIILCISMILWQFVPFYFSYSFMKYSWIMFMLVMGISIYPLLLMGWSSACLFSSLGSLRSVAQLVSYETIMGSFIFFWMISMNSISLNSEFMTMGGWISFFPFVYFMWFVTCLAETNRTPFDFSEGESELVSGFNTEYASQLFALIFMAEYLSIVMMSVIFSILLGKSHDIWIFGTLIMSLWIWVRATYVRHRYDKLMSMCWKSLLPLILIVIIIFFFFNILS